MNRARTQADVPGSDLRVLSSVLALSVFLLSGCGRTSAQAPLPEEPAELLSVVEMSDPRGFVQLVSGFWHLEGNAWRWATKNFKVVLRSPARAGANGARLQLNLRVPPIIHDRLGSVTLQAKVNGFALAPETYPEVQDYVYDRAVPAVALAKPAILVEFNTDKSTPSPGDTSRELSLIISSAGLIAK